MKKVGKDQSFPREYNIELVLSSLKDSPKSGTELAKLLSLSNATVSSIIKDLTEDGIIRVREFASESGLGRKRVVYEINKMYSLILSINISNLHAVVSLCNLHEEIMESIDLPIKKYDAAAIYQLILEATKIIMKYDMNKSPLGYIVISLPGMVNSKTGEFVLSKQFDNELFSEKHFIQNAFGKQFPNVPILLINDINLMTIGEMHCGALEKVDNAIYLSIDYGIGGGIVINNKLFDGDMGYAGEFGLLRHFDGVKYEAIDEYISLRALINASSKILNREITRDELFQEYEKNEDIHQLVIKSASILGKAIRDIYNVLNITHFVLSGRIINFKDDYLNEVRKYNKELDITFTDLSNKAEIIGAATLGVDYILKEANKK